LPDAEAVLRAAGDGDAHAGDVVRRAAGSVGTTVACLANMLDPEAIVIGGGLGLAPGAYWDELVPAIVMGIWRVREADVPPVVRAGLGEDAGVVGAALAYDH
jgi:predicted NBD/HSP70 family sugar kinase